MSRHPQKKRLPEHAHAGSRTTEFVWVRGRHAKRPAEHDDPVRLAVRAALDPEADVELIMPLVRYAYGID